ncbi:hypothetical protein H7I77_09825 [Mycolicibacterium novocastrense]|uniref:Exonuclease domain-containing protein n=1 Tax=Mycolicibacterium novocastrense TaxID=59813 RepID=A0AAW5SIN2_MYCNV|nr:MULTISPECIES: hypothetical protein [Mycolicibacterium]MCV7023644.1 hypothetical protein [Mycolicibacterium novocastrense]MDX1886879.1 hypothetical protein [Mycolicibacterium sp. 120270]
MTVLFLDTETTGVHDDRRAWEISMIRRVADADDTTITVFVHIDDIDLDHADPKGLDVGRFYQRHPAFGAALGPDQHHLSEREAAEIVDEWTAGAEIFGVRPRFDTVTLANALRRHRREPRWWRDPVDITELARGWMLAHGQLPRRNPEALSEQCGIDIPTPDLRHTAYGDAEWVLRWYDHLHAPALTANTTSTGLGRPGQQGHPEVASCASGAPEHLSVAIAQ